MLNYCHTCNQHILPGESTAYQHGNKVHLRCQINRQIYQAPWSFPFVSEDSQSNP
jgi:hypothetical protein